jgi:hypothetical protein
MNKLRLYTLFLCAEVVRAKLGGRRKLLVGLEVDISSSVLNTYRPIWGDSPPQLPLIRKPRKPSDGVSARRNTLWTLRGAAAPSKTPLGARARRVQSGPVGGVVDLVALIPDCPSETVSERNAPRLEHPPYTPAASVPISAIQG